MGYLWPNLSRSCASSRHFLLTVFNVLLSAARHQKLVNNTWGFEQWSSLGGGGHSDTIKTVKHTQSQNPVMKLISTKGQFLLVHSSPSSRERANRANGQTKTSSEVHISKVWLCKNLSKTTAESSLTIIFIKV